MFWFDLVFVWPRVVSQIFCSNVQTGYYNHGADSSNEFPYLHTTQTRARKVHASLATEWLSASKVHASVVTEWPPACLLKLLPEDIKEQMKNPRIKHVSKFNNICPTNPIHVLNLNEFFRRFCLCLSNDIFGMDKKISVSTGAPSQRKYPRDKANIANPKANRGSPSLTANGA